MSCWAFFPTDRCSPSPQNHSRHPLLYIDDRLGLLPQAIGVQLLAYTADRISVGTAVVAFHPDGYTSLLPTRAVLERRLGATISYMPPDDTIRITLDCTATAPVNDTGLYLSPT